jgi:hypothetical protein
MKRENGEKRENGTNGREEGVRKKGTHVSSSPIRPILPLLPVQQAYSMQITELLSDSYY